MSGPRHDCEACGIGRTSGRLCASCASAKNDTESPWDLGEGYWRLHKGVKVEWVPKFVLDVNPEPEPLKKGHVRCVNCPATFVPTRPFHSYCSRTCRKRAGWAKRSAKVNRARRQQRARARQETAA